MGKTDSTRNLPENPSLSMTLNGLSTFLEIELNADGKNGFHFATDAPETPAGVKTFPINFKPQAVTKFEKHYRRVQSRMAELAAARTDMPSVVLKSINTFPAGSGIASSASSFAALTLGAFLANAQDAEAAQALLKSEKGTALRRKLAKISREGSGSSCRSFEGPFVQWVGEDAQACVSRLPEMAHFVVVVSSGEKEVSSSEAHLRVKTSPLWNGRVERATSRFEQTRAAIEAGDFARIAKLAWDETWEMHSLFHTSDYPFTYWNAQTIDALHFFGEFFRNGAKAANSSGKGPIVTLDAGPNVHVLVPASERRSWQDRLVEKFGANRILEDGQGLGAEVIQVTR
jgi:diphosphomevalonate decarboxylase